MADEADMAQELEELALKHALAHRKEGVSLPPKGTCYNCDEKLAPAKVGRKPRQTLQHVRIFCDKDCAEDWEDRQKSKSQRLA